MGIWVIYGLTFYEIFFINMFLKYVHFDENIERKVKIYKIISI